MCCDDNVLFTGSTYAKDIYLYTRKAINPEVQDCVACVLVQCFSVIRLLFNIPNVLFSVQSDLLHLLNKVTV